MSAFATSSGSAAVALSGLRIAGTFATEPQVALLGFVLVGLGFANVVPVLFIAAGQVRGVEPAHGIASVASLAYLAMMAGPALIGVIAQHRSLGEGLGVVVVFALLLALGARRALPRH